MFCFPSEWAVTVLKCVAPVCFVVAVQLLRVVEGSPQEFPGTYTEAGAYPDQKVCMLCLSPVHKIPCSFGAVLAFFDRAQGLVRGSLVVLPLQCMFSGSAPLSMIPPCQKWCEPRPLPPALIQTVKPCPAALSRRR